MAVSADGAYAKDDTALITLIDAQSCWFTGVSARTSQHVENIEFVSHEFGFLLGRSIAPADAERNDWSIVPASLERFGLDGTRQVIVDAIPYPISSMAVSADGKLVAVCTKPLMDEKPVPVWAECRVYSLEDGKLVSRVQPAEATVLKAGFIGESESCLIASQPFHPGHPQAYLVSAKSGEILQESTIADSITEIYSLVTAPQSNEAYVATTAVVWRFAINGRAFEFEKFHTKSAIRNTGVNPKWMAFDPIRQRLAVGEETSGTYHLSATTIIDIPSRTAMHPSARTAGPMRFSPDGNSLFVLGSPVTRVNLRPLRLKRDTAQ
ncbi:MAG: hypothetical protein R3C17_20950 [Planctomycetaceae bacterium]